MFSKKFYAATREYTEFDRHVPAPLMRKSFTLNEKVTEAKITICGLGFYELFINGKRITKGLLAPYISNPDDILYYDTYDLAPYLSLGENVIGIILGNGFLNNPGGTVWDFDKADYRSAPKVAFSFEARLNSGEMLSFTADETIKTHPSAILFDDYRCGEFYDARKEIPGWNEPGFSDDGWLPAIPAETPRGIASLCGAEPIKVYETLAPVGITKGKIVFNERVHRKLKTDIFPCENDASGYIYDFGKNTAGNIVLKIKGTAGQRVSMYFGELLNGDGDIDHRCHWFEPKNYQYHCTYTLKGGETEIYRPMFCYMGFRYCLVSGITGEQATSDLLDFEVMSSDLKKNGDFYCSDETINTLQKMAVNSDRSNFYYFPTDCPHREKNGWTGDAALSAEQMLFNLTVENSYREWLRNIRSAQRVDGALPGIIPTGGWGFDWGNGTPYDNIIVYLPYYVWLYRNDTEIIRENAAAIMRYLNFLSSNRGKDGLLEYGLGDWMQVGCIGSCENSKAPLNVVCTLVAMDACRKAASMFGAVGMELQKQFSENLFAELRAAARTRFIERDGVTVMGRCQTSQAIAIKFGLFDDAEKPGAAAKLVEYIVDEQGHLNVGCVGLRQIFHVLSDHGYTELALKMIEGPEFPSYGYFIDGIGATAIPESFKEKDKRQDSLNHHFFGDISSWFVRTFAGIKVNPFECDANEVEISPEFIEKLDFAEGYIGVPAGKVEVKWKREQEKIILDISVPDGVYGYIRLPDGWLFADIRTTVKKLSSGKFELIGSVIE